MEECNTRRFFKIEIYHLLESGFKKNNNNKPPPPKKQQQQKKKKKKKKNPTTTPPKNISKKTPQKPPQKSKTKNPLKQNKNCCLSDELLLKECSIYKQCNKTRKTAVPSILQILHCSFCKAESVAVPGGGWGGGGWGWVNGVANHSLPSWVFIYLFLSLFLYFFISLFIIYLFIICTGLASHIIYPARSAAGCHT